MPIKSTPPISGYSLKAVVYAIIKEAADTILIVAVLAIGLNPGIERDISGNRAIAVGDRVWLSWASDAGVVLTR